MMEILSVALLGVTFVVSCIAGWILVVPIHEAGHALAAKLVGGKIEGMFLWLDREQLQHASHVRFGSVYIGYPTRQQGCLRWSLPGEFIWKRAVMWGAGHAAVVLFVLSLIPGLLWWGQAHVVVGFIALSSTMILSSALGCRRGDLFGLWVSVRVPSMMRDRIVRDGENFSLTLTELPCQLQQGFYRFCSIWACANFAFATWLAVVSVVLVSR